MAREKRFRESERLLLNLRSRNCPFKNIDFDLANLYFRAGKYCSALAHLLIRKADGHDVPPDLLAFYQKRMLKSASLNFKEDPHGAFLIGKTLLMLGGSTEKAIYFLEQSVVYGGHQSWVGFAALELADVYRGRDEILCRKFLKLAETHGTPEILIPRKSSLK